MTWCAGIALCVAALAPAATTTQEAAVATRPAGAAVLMDKARAAVKAGNLAEADQAFLAAIAAARSEEATLPTSGQVQLQECYHEYARFNHDWALAGTGLSKTQRAERFAGAVAALRRVLNLAPDNLKARQFLTDIYWSVAGSSQSRGWAEFVKEADELIKLKGDDAQAYFRRGVAKANLVSGDAPGVSAKDAIEDIQKAISLKKDEADYRLALIGLLRRLEGRDAEVEQAFRTAVEEAPGSAKMLVAYAAYLQERGKLDDARQWLDKAVQKDPVLGNLALSDFHATQGKLEEALKAADAAVRIDKSDGRAYLRKAAILARQGQLLAAEAVRPGLAGATRPATAAAGGPAARKTAEAVAVLKEGLVEAAAATQPAGPPSHPTRAETLMDLNYLLADLLLDMVERGEGDRARLLEDAADCLRSLTMLGLAGPRRAKVTGRIALARGQTAQAIEELEAAFNGSGAQDIKTANILINLYLRQNLPGKADAVLDKLLSVPGLTKNASVLMAKARLLMRYRDFEKADQIATRVLQLEPGNAEALAMRATIQAARGEVATSPGKGPPPSPDATRLLLDRAATLWLDQQRDEAIRLVEQLHRGAPKDRQIVNRLFSMYRSANRAGDAEKLLDEAMGYWPDDKSLAARRLLVREKDPARQYDILMQVADEYAEPQRSLEKAGIAQTMGKPQEYVRYLLEASKADPNNPEVVDRVFRLGVERKDWKLAGDCVVRARNANLDGAQGRIYQTRLAVSRQDNDAAIASALEVLSSQPNRKDARVLLGQAYMRKHQNDQAYEEFKTVHDSDPAYVPALVGLVAVTQAQGKIDEHRSRVEAAWRLVPQDPYIRQRHLEIERETARPEDQIKQLEGLVKRDPNDMGNLANLAGLYERAGRGKDAEDTFRRLHDKSLDKLYSARVLCGFYLRKGRLQDVQRTVEPLLESKADPVGVRVLYGELVLQQDPEKAKGLFQQAIAANADDPRGHLGLARCWAAMRNWPFAVECMTAYVRLRPQDAGGARELVRYAIEAGDNKLAAKRLEEMLQADPSDTAAITLKGILAWREGQIATAMALFAKAIQGNPSFVEPLVQRARLLLVEGEPDKAKADLQAARRLTNRLDVSMQLVDVYLGIRDFDGAESILRELRAAYPGYSPVIDQLIGLYLQRQKWRELEELLGEARKAAPANPGYWLAEAQMWAIRQDEPKRLEAHAQAVKVAPQDTRPVRDYLIALQDAKRHETLLEVSQPYVDREGFTGWVDAFRATALVRLGRQDEADKAFLKALQLAQPAYVLILVRQLQFAYGANAPAKLDAWLAGEQGKNWRAHLVLGVLCSETRDYPKAIEALSKARDLADDPLAQFLAWRHLGATYYLMRDFPETEKAYLECVKLRGDDLQVLNNLAYLYTSDLNQPRKGLPLAERAARQSPDNARVLDTYAWTLAKLGRLADGEGTLLRAVQAKPPLAAARYHLGWIYENTRRLDEAIKQYRMALEMMRDDKTDPLYRTVQEAIERVTKQQAPGGGK